MLTKLCYNTIEDMLLTRGLSVLLSAALDPSQAVSFICLMALLSVIMLFTTVGVDVEKE